MPVKSIKTWSVPAGLDSFNMPVVTLDRKKSDGVASARFEAKTMPVVTS